MFINCSFTLVGWRTSCFVCSSQQVEIIFTQVELILGIVTVCLRFVHTSYMIQGYTIYAWVLRTRQWCIQHHGGFLWSLFSLRLMVCCGSSWYIASWILGFVRPSAIFCELLKKPLLLIFDALYAFRVAYISNIYQLSLVWLPFDKMSHMLLKSVKICTGIACLKTNSNCLRISSESSNRSARRASLRTVRNLLRVVTCMICIRLV